MEKFIKIKEHINQLQEDADKFYNKGNAAAGTRLRNGLQQLKGLAQEARTDVTAKKKA